MDELEWWKVRPQKSEKDSEAESPTPGKRCFFRDLLLIPHDVHGTGRLGGDNRGLSSIQLIKVGSGAKAYDKRKERGAGECRIRSLFRKVWEISGGDRQRHKARLSRCGLL